MTRRFQFSLRTLLAATLLTAIGFALLLQADGVTIWQFAFFVSTGWAAFGAAFGVVVGKVREWTTCGIAIGILATIAAAYGEEIGALQARLPQPWRWLLSPK